MRPSPIEAARARHSLADVARRAGIDLYRSSGSVMAHCPLPSHGHFDRSPSLRLHLDDGIWHCFGCGQTGDVVEWVCQSEGVRWGEAIRILDSGRSLTRAWTSGEMAFGGRDLSSGQTPPTRFATRLRHTRADRLSRSLPNTGGSRLRRSGDCLDLLQPQLAP